MPSFKDYGIVMGGFSLGEFDKVLNIYTKENGLVRAVAKGLKKTKSKFAGKLEMLSCCLFHFARGKNLHVVTDCMQINSFPQLRLDLKRLTYGLLCLEVVGNFANELDSDSSDIYELLYLALDKLQHTGNPHLFTLWFLIKFLSVHGFRPQLSTCVSCSKGVRNGVPPEQKEIYPYSSVLGGLLCSECSKEMNYKQVNPEVLNIIDRVYDSLPVTTSLPYEDISKTMDLIMEHINVRARNKIKSFDLLVTL